MSQVTMTAAQQKAEKLERKNAKNRKFLLHPNDYRERVLEPLVKRAIKLLDLAVSLGNSANASAGAVEAEKNDQIVTAIRAKLPSIKADFVKDLRAMGTYYNTLYKVNGKRAEKASNGVVSKPRQSIMFRSVSHFQPGMLAFVREASKTHDSLRVAGESVCFNSSSPLHNYMSPTFAAQFILAYVATHRRFNKTNGQYIQPDELMHKHLGAGITKVLASINASIAAESDPKKKERLSSFPGQFTFCKLQELIGFYRVKPAEGSAAALTLTTVRENKDNWTVLREEFDSMSKVRSDAYQRLHDENPKAVKVAGTKGRSGPLSEQEKHSRRVKREMNALAAGMNMEVTLAPKAPKAPKAVVATA